MKRSFLILIIPLFFCYPVFCETANQEEIDFLLFQPNSSGRFTDESRAMVQLDNLAKYLKEKNPISGQICVYGYAAEAANNIDPVALSRERAVHVIDELLKRGLPAELFSEPVGYGSVNLWGSNLAESDRMLNRRVRVLLDGIVITPAEIVPVDITPPAAAVIEPKVTAETAQENNPVKSGFPWWILFAFIALILVLLLIALFNRKKPAKPPVIVPAEDTDNRTAADESAVSPVIAAAITAEPVIAAAAVSVIETVKNLEEEIRFRAYELYLRRNGEYGDADGDWFAAVGDICAKYQADGYTTYTGENSWWARRIESIRP